MEKCPNLQDPKILDKEITKALILNDNKKLSEIELRVLNLTENLQNCGKYDSKEISELSKMLELIKKIKSKLVSLYKVGSIFYYDKDDYFYVYNIDSHKYIKAMLTYYKESIVFGGSCKYENKIYFAGGFDRYRNAYVKTSAVIIVFNLDDKDLYCEERPLPDLIYDRRGNSLVGLNNYATFSIGGYTSGFLSPNCEKYDTNLGKWVHIQSLNNLRAMPIVICPNQRYIYCIGGLSEHKIEAFIERYDALDNSPWEIVNVDPNFITVFGKDSFGVGLGIAFDELLIFSDKRISSYNITNNCAKSFTNEVDLNTIDTVAPLLYKNKIFKIQSDRKKYLIMSINQRKVIETVTISDT